jgi:hypothetical protein
MTKDVVNANMDMELGDFKVSMKCLSSGAFAIAGSAFSAAAVMASLF